MSRRSHYQPRASFPRAADRRPAAESGARSARGVLRAVIAFVVAVASVSQFTPGSQPMPSVEDIRRIVRDHFAEGANWRRHKAMELELRRPDAVAKNVRYAESIEAVAAFAEALPDDDPAWAALAACAELTDAYEGLRIPGGVHPATIHLGDRWKGLVPDAVEAEFRAWVAGAIAEAKNPTPRADGL